MTWRAEEREVKQEIMRTDVFVRVLSEQRSAALMRADIDHAFELFRDFVFRLSRFREGSEISKLNSSEVCRVSPELFEILLSCRVFFKETGGVFDPTILPILEAEGYGASYGSAEFGRPKGTSPVPLYTFADVILDEETLTVQKPLACRVDIGGIGKGYVVDQVSAFLKEYYTDFIVDAGGDIYVAGRNHFEGYPYFALDIEDAREAGTSAGVLLLSDRAVATSGVNRRRWQRNQQEKSHLIDARAGTSINNDVLSATVIAETTQAADVYAKTLCLLGSVRGLAFADQKRLPAFFLLKDGTIRVNNLMRAYLWKDE